jgi:hypothetical protein
MRLPDSVGQLQSYRGVTGRWAGGLPTDAQCVDAGPETVGAPTEEVRMNRIQRIATASAVGAAVLAPATGAAVAVARPDPGPSLQTHVEHERIIDQAAPNSEAGVPWEAIGLAAVAGAAVAAGTMVVVRHSRHEATPASA